MEVINNQVRKLLQTMLIHILLSPLHSGVGVKRAYLTEEESDVIRQSNIANHWRGMQESAVQTHLAGACVIEHNINVLDINAPFLVNICSCVEKETCVQRCKDLIRHTLVTPKGVDYSKGLVIHKTLVFINKRKWTEIYFGFWGIELCPSMGLCSATPPHPWGYVPPPHPIDGGGVVWSATPIDGGGVVWSATPHRWGWGGVVCHPTPSMGMCSTTPSHR